jgi:hypothetical protein
MPKWSEWNEINHSLSDAVNGGLLTAIFLPVVDKFIAKITPCGCYNKYEFLSTYGDDSRRS